MTITIRSYIVVHDIIYVHNQSDKILGITIFLKNLLDLTLIEE